MKHTYTLTGMTCGGCANSVKEKLSEVNGVQEVQVDLAKAEAEITMNTHLALEVLQGALPEKYTIIEKGHHQMPLAEPLVKSKIQQLRPLFLIFTYLFATAYFLNYKDWDLQQAMLDFMGLFYLVFSFFKLLDLKGFPESFRMYDPLAKAVPFYGKIYPFIELALGLMFVFRVEVTIALWCTLLVLGVTTYGVAKTLLDKKAIKCACLGTALNLPMTEATFIENAIMLVMAIFMLIP